MKVVRRAQHYLKYEFRDIAWPRALPDPPDIDPAKKPWTWEAVEAGKSNAATVRTAAPSAEPLEELQLALLIQAIQYANERYRDSWTSKKVTEGPTAQKEDAAGSGLKEELSKCPCTTSVHR